MHFGSPLLLLLLLFVPICAAVIAWGSWSQRRSVLRFAGAGLELLRRGQVRRARQVATASLLLLVTALLVIAIARPQIGSHRVLLPREGSDVVLALDVSRSMGVNDVAPSRLDHARRAANALIDHLGGDRVGVVVFAGSASLRFPLTTDFNSAEQVIDGLGIQDSNVSGGTNIASALKTARDALTGDKTTGKVIVLISDGEDLSGNDLAAAQDAAKAGVALDTVGVGTATGGPVFAVNPSTNAATPIIDPDTGSQAISHRDDAHLHQLASAGHGTAYDGNTTDFAFDLSTAIDNLQKTRFESGDATIPIERFQIPLAIALALLALETLVSAGMGRRGAAGRRPAALPAETLSQPSVAASAPATPARMP